MTEQKLTDEQGFKEDKVMRMFFGQGVDTMARDGYDGSKQEKHIFMEVFNVINAGNASNHNVALHTMNFQKGESSQSNLNCENSVLTSYFSIKDSSGEASRPACIYSREVSGSGCFLDDSSSGAVSDPCNAHVKQMKLSSIEQQNHKSVEQSYSLSVSGDDLIDVGQSENYSSVLMQHQQQSPCLIVETCGHGILSSYHLRKTEEEIGGSDDIALNIECKSQDVRDDKIANEAKSVTSPVSQGSFSSGLLVLSATDTPAETPEVPICMKHIMKESSILKCGTVDVASKRVLIRELPERLRSHANCLLIDAGWKIEPRVRSDRTKLASYFIAPKEKLVVTSFSQAWKACGKRLYASVMDSEQEDNGREWTNIDRFRGDLTDTLSYIEKKTQTTGISISLLKRWQLLDPFVAVICINRKIGVLQEGRALKAVKSATFILSGENNIVLADECVDRVAHLAKLNSSSGTCLNHNVSAIQLDHKSEKVTEVSRKQQRLQNYHDLQGSSQCKRQKQQLRCCAETQRRCLKSLAGCMENGLHDTRCSLNMSYKDLASPNNAVNGSDSLLTFTAKDLCSTHSGSFGDFSAQDSLTPVLETSPTDDLNTYKVAFINKSLSLQESSVPSGPSAELLVRNQPCKCKPNKKVSKEVREQRTVIPAKRRVYGKNHSESVCCDRPDLLGHENPANVMRVADEKLEMETSACNPGCNDGRLAFNIHSSITTKKVVVRASKSKDPNSSGNQVSDVNRKIHKKSKRISDIRATEVDGTCDGTCTEVLSSHFDVKIDDHLESLCNQENSQRLLCKSTLGCMKENSCKMEACSTINIWRKTMKSETKASSQHVKAKKGNLATSLEVKMENTSTDADIDDEDIQYFKKKGCNSKGLSSQVPSLPKLPSLSNKNHHKCAVPEYSFVTSDDGNIATGGKTKNSEVLCHVGISPDPKDSQKDAKPKEPEACKKSKWKRPRGFRINDDDLLIAAIIKNKDYVSCKDKQGSKLGVSQPKKLKKLESQKGGCKLLLRAPGKGGLSKDGKEIILGARTVLCWLIERGVLSLKDVLQYRTSKNNAMVKDGWITRNGILCKCCMKIFSVSAFKAHSGSKLQKPSSNLFLQSGRSYTLCQLQAWSAEYKMRKGRIRGTRVDEVDQNDDACGLCGDGGELICCDNCPSTYHQTCLTIKDLPEGSWYCHNCICRGCEHAVNATKEASSSLAVLECSQCEHKYHDICVKKRNLNDGEVESDTWFCGRKCQEVYLGLRSRIGILNCLGDGFSWTILRCNHDDQKIQSTQKIVLMAECNTKLAIALSIMEECFLRMVDPRTGIDMIPHLLYNWGSKFTRLNYQGFYTVVLEKSDEVISVASIRVHGVTMAEMPLIATCSEYRQQGMCRRLIDAIEEMLKSFKVKMLLLSAIPSLVDTWTSHFGFKPIDDAERRQLNHVNLMLLPGTVLLIKNLEEEEESGSKSDSCLRDNQSMNPDGFNDETGRTDSDEEALLPTMNVTYQMEEHDLQQKDLLISSCGMPTSTAKHNDNDVRISGSLCRKIANLNIQMIDQFDSAEHTEQDTFTCMSVVSKSTALHSCSASVTIRTPDDQFPADPVPVVPIVNNSESEKVSILSETEAKHIMEEDNRLLIEGDVIEEKVLFILQK